MSVSNRPLRPENFIAKEGPCWIWKGAYYPDNTPLYMTRGKGKNARKVVFEKYVTKIGWSFTLVPKCNDPRCVCPEHQSVVKRASLVE